MPAFVCATCGVQFSPSDEPPPACPICQDERQYIGRGGQRWTTLEELRRSHRNVLEEEEPGLTSIRSEPSFAIGQRALLVRTPEGNVLWDCITLLDDATVDAVRALGGVEAIAISHPHFHGSCVEWSDAFGGAPIYVHHDDRRWVMRNRESFVFWAGEEIEPVPGTVLLRLGGHFPGAAVLHWPAGADGRGALLSGDTIAVVEDRRHVSFMYSYPNLIPLSPETVMAIADRVTRYRFDRIYGAWRRRVVDRDGVGAVRRSAERYAERVRGG